MITVPAVSTARSSSIAFLLSPNPGDLTTTVLITPLILLITRVASASPSTSSAIIINGCPDLATCSSTGRISLMFEIFLSCNKMYGFSNTLICLSALLIKYGERYPLSNCIPSTTANSISSDLPSSTVITPSFPTLSIASAIILPISLSLLAEIVPTC